MKYQDYLRISAAHTVLGLDAPHIILNDRVINRAYAESMRRIHPDTRSIPLSTKEYMEESLAITTAKAMLLVLIGTGVAKDKPEVCPKCKGSPTSAPMCPTCLGTGKKRKLRRSRK